MNIYYRIIHFLSLGSNSGIETEDLFYFDKLFAFPTKAALANKGKYKNAYLSDTNFQKFLNLLSLYELITWSTIGWHC